MKNKGLLNIISLFWFLKFIFDMFYMQKILTVVISLFSFIILIISLKEYKMKFRLTDLFVLIMIILFTRSFLKSTELYIDYLKIVSAFVMYFLGRILYTEENKIEKSILLSLSIVFVINLIVCLTGNGSTIWGSASTLRGLYYFKTDYACMLSFFLTFWLFSYNKNKLCKLIILLISIVLIILTNARIYYLISFMIVIMYFLYKKNKKIISFRTMSTLLLGTIIVIFGISQLSNLTFFREKNMIGLNYNSIEDLYDSSNTQGRNEVWNTLLFNFSKQDIITRTFGTSLDFYKENSYNGYTEHNTYVKVLLNTGYFGLIVFILFICSILLSIRKINDYKTEYLIFTLILIFLVSGISAPTILYVNTSWLPLFYAGLSISNSLLIEKKENKKEEKEINEIKKFLTQA